MRLTRLVTLVVSMSLVGAPLAGCLRHTEAPMAELTVATGTPGGVYEVLGRTYAGAAHARWGIPSRAIETGAAIDNLQRLADGSADVAFTTLDAARLAETGERPFDRPQDVQGIAALYDDDMQVVVRKGTQISRLEDLRGHRVSLGAPGSGSDLFARRLMRVAGLDISRDVTALSLGASQSAQALREGRIDAFFFSGGVPTPAVTALAADAPIALLPLTPYVAAMQAMFGDVYFARTIPESAYHLGAAVETLAVLNILVVRSGLSDRQVYALTGLLFSSKHELVRANRVASGLTTRRAVALPGVRLHPGAVRWYRHAKIDLA